MNISILVPPDQDDDIPEIMMRIRNRQTTKRFRTRRMCKNGDVINASLNVSPVIDANDNIIGASTIAHRA